MIDYILVGLGLAGIAFCEKLEEHKKSFIVFDCGKEASSIVAAGLYNPVILKRFTPAWNAADQMKRVGPFYGNLETKLGIKVDYKQPVYRIFHSVEEQNLWFEASDRPKLQPFLSTTVHQNKNEMVRAPLGYGEVLHSGRVDTAKLLRAYRTYLLKQRKLIEAPFEYHKLRLSEDFDYEDIKARHIVFAEGFGLKKNPFFKNIPLEGNKGELLTIKASALKLDTIVKSSVFVIPLGDDLYRVGATYNRTDKTKATTQEAREELLNKLEKIIRCSYQVVSHDAGIRPTVLDRKPLVGQHPVNDRMYLLNGMGSHGVMIAPYVAEQLYDFIEKGGVLNEEIDISRFK